MTEPTQEITTKLCRDCKEELPLDAFSPNKKGGVLGRASYCKPCQKARSAKWFQENRERRYAYAREWEARNPERAARIKQESRFKFSYGITYEQYEEMLAAQDGICAICQGEETATTAGTLRSLSVDHDHETGVVRGLLCHRCNIALGGFRDDYALLQRALDYLNGERP